MVLRIQATSIWLCLAGVSLIAAAHPAPAAETGQPIRISCPGGQEVPSHRALRDYTYAIRTTGPGGDWQVVTPAPKNIPSWHGSLVPFSVSGSTLRCGWKNSLLPTVQFTGATGGACIKTGRTTASCPGQSGLPQAGSPGIAPRVVTCPASLSYRFDVTPIGSDWRFEDRTRSVAPELVLGSSNRITCVGSGAENIDLTMARQVIPTLSCSRDGGGFTCVPLRLQPVNPIPKPIVNPVQINP